MNKRAPHSHEACTLVGTSGMWSPELCHLQGISSSAGDRSPVDRLVTSEGYAVEGLAAGGCGHAVLVTVISCPSQQPAVLHARPLFSGGGVEALSFQVACVA